MTATATDPRVAALRKLARSLGWDVSRVTRAKNRAPIALVAERTFRAAWTPKNLSQHAIIERIEVRVDSFDDQVRASRVFVRRGFQDRISFPPGFVESFADGSAFAEYLLSQPVPDDSVETAR